MGEPLVVPAWCDPDARDFRLSWADTQAGLLTVDDDRFRFATAAGVMFDVPRDGATLTWLRDRGFGRVPRFDLAASAGTYRLYLGRPAVSAPPPAPCDDGAPRGHAAAEALRAVLRPAADAQHDPGRRLMLAVDTTEYTCECLTFSPDDALLAAGLSNGMVGVWDLAGRAPVRYFMHDLCGGPVRAVAFSGDGLLLATAGHDGLLKVRDVRSGHVLLKRQHPAAICAVCFDAAGERLATACADGVVRVWSRRGDIRARIDGGCTAATRRVGFAPDGTIAVGGPGRRAGTVDAYSPDGRLRAAATRDGLRVWTPAPS